MEKCEFSIKRSFNGNVMEIVLSSDEIWSIWNYYNYYKDERFIWEKLQNDYDAVDYAVFKNTVEDIAYSYRKNLGFGYDEELSMFQAFEEAEAAIRGLLS
jgi:hypothetical protein